MLAPLNFTVEEATHESPKYLDPGVNDSNQVDIGKASVDHMDPELLDDNAVEDTSQNMDVIRSDVEAVMSMVRDRNNHLRAQVVSEHQKKPTDLLVLGLESKTMEHKEMF
ncbi:hypothetical protein Nepgr_014593 [Nepenthes gracilis]|uniref:Uncharacterized protein n=1 Tax=Nepenthes gracilis TaxID=150966 RepID=A0AAD3SLH3_NEPGR|nr:hypothetical protein Nepgr_014593 [Nepenthes gracilis]